MRTRSYNQPSETVDKLLKTAFFKIKTAIDREQAALTTLSDADAPSSTSEQTSPDSPSQGLTHTEATGSKEPSTANLKTEPTPAHSVPSPDHPSPSLHVQGDEIEGLLFQLQHQLETVIAQHASISPKSAATRSRIETQETTLETKAPQAVSSPCAANAEDLHPVRDKITHWRTLFADQFGHLRTLAQDSMTRQQQLEAALTRANRSIRKLQNQLNTQPTARQKSSEVITTLHAELSDQKNLLSETRAKLQAKEMTRKQVERILKGRFKKKPGSTVTMHLKAQLKKKPGSTVTMHLKARLKKKPGSTVKV
ncbi:MAG: hypothetical protein HQ515_21620 [Phycisphaeraceae bacterium]|nr:hypothetical protein [Phycisphaeraceae bacterium]